MRTMFKLMSVLLPVAVVWAVAPIGRAQTVPYIDGGSGVYNPFTAEYATQGRSNFGRSNGLGTAIPMPTSDPYLSNWVTNGEVSETFQDGSEIFFIGGGEFRLIPICGMLHTAIWTGEYTVTRGTGRFAGIGPAARPLQVIAVNTPFVYPPTPGDTWPFFWTLKGKVRFSH